jgi:uncharacterized oligopeptide transporter (OPT) family protein
VSQFLRQTTTYRLLTVHRYVALNVPRTTTAAGILLMGVIAGVHLYLLFQTSGLPRYLGVYFGVLSAACLVAAVLSTIGPRARLVRAGWALGAAASIVFLAVYLISRLAGLPDVPQAEAWWDCAPATLAGACALGYLGLVAAIGLGVTVAYPWKRGWHD